MIDPDPVNLHIIYPGRSRSIYVELILDFLLLKKIAIALIEYEVMTEIV